MPCVLYKGIVRLGEKKRDPLKTIEVLEVIVYHDVGFYQVLVAAKHYLLPRD